MDFSAALRPQLFGGDEFHVAAHGREFASDITPGRFFAELGRGQEACLTALALELQMARAQAVLEAIHDEWFKLAFEWNFQVETKHDHRQQNAGGPRYRRRRSNPDLPTLFAAFFF